MEKKVQEWWYHIKGGTIYRPAPKCGAEIPEGFEVRGWVHPQRRGKGPFVCAICPRGACIHPPPPTDGFLWLEHRGDRPAERSPEDICPACKGMADEVIAWDQKSRALCRVDLVCRKLHPCSEHGGN